MNRPSQIQVNGPNGATLAVSCTPADFERAWERYHHDGKEVFHRVSGMTLDRFREVIAYHAGRGHRRRVEALRGRAFAKYGEVIPGPFGLTEVVPIAGAE